MANNQHRNPQVNHKDGNKHNNSAHNLEWATGSENMRHALAVLPEAVHKNLVLNVETGCYFSGVAQAYRASSFRYGSMSISKI